MKKIAVISIFSGLIALNILTLVSSAVHNALYGLLDDIMPASWLSNSLSSHSLDKDKELKKRKSELREKNKKLRETRNKVAKTRTKIQKRVIRNATRNVGAIPAESMPVIGIATIVAVTTMDLKDACDTMTDLDDLSVTLGFEEVDPKTTKVCGKKVPSKEEVMSDLGIDEESYRQFLNDYEEWRMNLGGFLNEIFNGAK